MKTSHVAQLMLVVLVGLSVSSNAEDRRTDRSKLVIMTLNAEFLWDGVQPEEGQVNFDWKGSQTEAEDHMANVAEIVISGNPDILNLVEVENLQALATFNDKFLAGRGYKAYLVNGKDTTTGEDVALLTRIDPEGDAIQRDDRKGQAGTITKSVSKNYEAKFDVDGLQFSVVGIHFLAFPNMQARRQLREAQADAIRSIARDLRSNGFPPVILGDFNDYDGNADSEDHVNSMPITQVLSMLRGMDPSTSTDDLVNAASLVPQAIRFTAFHDANDNGQLDPPNEFTSIDHVLLSPELAAKVVSVEIPHNHDPRLVTDHFPVIVRLNMGPTTPTGGQIRIVSLLPNPDGDENQNEQITFQNGGTTTITLTGWKVRDLAQRTWTLDALGALNAGESKTMTRDGQPMALNNGGDTIDLIDPSGVVVQTVTYPRVEEEEIVTIAN